MRPGAERVRASLEDLASRRLAEDVLQDQLPSNPRHAHSTEGGRVYQTVWQFEFFGTWSMHNRENCGTGFSRKLQLVLVVILLQAFSIFSLSPFHRFEDWTAQHQTRQLRFNVGYITSTTGNQ